MGMGMGMVVVAVVSVAGCLVVVSLAFLPSFALSSSLSAFPIFLSHFGGFFCCQFFEGSVDLFFKICFFSISIFFRMVLGKLGPSPIWRQIGPRTFWGLIWHFWTKNTDESELEMADVQKEIEAEATNLPPNRRGAQFA